MSNTLKSAISCDTMPQGTLSVEQAQERILESITPLDDMEYVALLQAAGRMLAHPVYAQMNVPPHTNSAMDGYALRHADLAEGRLLKIVGSSFAGHPFAGVVQAGECVRIMTGAVLPAGADTVVMQENVQCEDHAIHVSGKLSVGENVRHAGEDSKVGDLLLVAGHKLNAADIGLLASQGIANVAVIRRLRVAFCSTGDELKILGDTLQPGDIYDSNRYILHTLLQKLDVEMFNLGVVRDTRESVEMVFCHARDMADVFITSGGVSVGEADYVTDTLKSMGQVNFWKIAFKPGKPLAFGALGNCLFFGLPGNPVSVMATFLLFVRPAILALRGETVPLVPEYTAICDTPLKKEPGRKDYQRGICECDSSGQWHVRTTGNQGSHVLRSMSQANCFIVLPLEWGNVEAGIAVTIIPFEGLM